MKIQFENADVVEDVEDTLKIFMEYVFLPAVERNSVQRRIDAFEGGFEVVFGVERQIPESESVRPEVWEPDIDDI